MIYVIIIAFKKDLSIEAKIVILKYKKGTLKQLAN